MATPEKLRARIAELISRPHNVEYEEIVWVLNQLGTPKPRAGKHGDIFKVPGCSERLQLNHHNNGKPHLPRYCVDQFVERMIELGLYE